MDGFGALDFEVALPVWLGLGYDEGWLVVLDSKVEVVGRGGCAHVGVSLGGVGVFSLPLRSRFLPCLGVWVGGIVK